MSVEGAEGSEKGRRGTEDREGGRVKRETKERGAGDRQYMDGWMDGMDVWCLEWGRETLCLCADDVVDGEEGMATDCSSLSLGGFFLCSFVFFLFFCTTVITRCLW